MDIYSIRAKPAAELTPEEAAQLTDEEKAARGIIYDPCIYDINWFRWQGWQHVWTERLLGWLVGEYGPFHSSLDLGAGDGCYSHALAQMGASPANAVEIHPDALSVMASDVIAFVHDLRTPLDLERTYDLVVCLEVAEHLPLEAADILCDTITRHCSGWLLFTAAPPGQGGYGHCNLKPFHFWADRLYNRGVQFQTEDTVRIRTAWKRILGENLLWLSRNISLFKRV